MIETKKIINLVKCPDCGREYTLDEIFIPNSLVGKTKEVMRTTEGKIDYIQYEVTPDLDEKYICDKCGATLVFHANIDVSVTKATKKTKEPFKVALYGTGRVKLAEE